MSVCGPALIALENLGLLLEKGNATTKIGQISEKIIKKII
jgi:hypothetical protein